MIYQITDVSFKLRFKHVTKWCLSSVIGNSKKKKRVILVEGSTWYKYRYGRLHSFTDDVVQSEHPVRLDVVVSQHFIHLEM